MSDNEISENLPSPQPAELPAPKKRGAPYGNHNAVKHGIYVHRSHVWNTTLLEMSELCDVKDQILALKEFMMTTFYLIRDSKDSKECPMDSAPSPLPASPSPASSAPITNFGPSWYPCPLKRKMAPILPWTRLRRNTSAS